MCLDGNSRRDQLSFDGFEDRAPLTDRLFFAVFPDAATAQRLGALGRQLRHDLGLRGKPLADERFHVTLHHLGDFPGLPAGVVEKATQAAASVAAAPFHLSFDSAMSFAGRPSGRPFVLRAGAAIEPLMAFQRELVLGLARVGLVSPASATFTPHITMLYDDRLVAEAPIEPVRWTAYEFVLVHSRLGHTQHVALGRWPLRDRRAA